MRFIQYFIDDREALGSDGVHLLDGRWGLVKCKDEGFIQAHRLRHVQPSYTAFQIKQGPKFSDARAVSPLISLKQE